MYLTRKQKEELVIELYFNQNKTYREIAKEVKMSLRDIQRIVGEEVDRRQSGQSLVKSSQALALFLKNKSPIDVAIELNMPPEDVTELYEEYLRLNKPYDLCKIYEEMKGCLDSFLKLYRMIIESGMGIQEVMYTVIIANYGLPSVEQRYKTLQNKVNDLEFRKQSLEQENDTLRSDVQYYSSVLEEERMGATKSPL